LAGLDSKMVLDGGEDIIGIAEHAWRGGAHLDKVLADLFPAKPKKKKRDKSVSEHARRRRI